MKLSVKSYQASRPILQYSATRPHDNQLYLRAIEPDYQVGEGNGGFQQTPNPAAGRLDCCPDGEIPQGLFPKVRR